MTPVERAVLVLCRVSFAAFLRAVADALDAVADAVDVPVTAFTDADLEAFLSEAEADYRRSRRR